MATITQHIPKYLSTVLEPISAEFETQEELLEIPFVKKFRMTYQGKKDEYFHKYSIDADKLIVEAFNGDEFFVIGFITGEHNLHLPKWVHNEEATKKCQNSFHIP